MVGPNFQGNHGQDLLQPLDLTTNSASKKIERKEFSNYFSECIAKALLANPENDITTVKVDLTLKALKPWQALTKARVYKYLKSEKGKEIILAGWKASGISDAVRKGRNGDILSLDPFQ